MRPITIPGYMVSQALANRLRSGLPSTVVKFDPNVGIPLAESSSAVHRAARSMRTQR